MTAVDVRNDRRGAPWFATGAPRRAFQWIACFAFTLTVGCSKGLEFEPVPVFPVNGQVLVDGTPAASAEVYFWPITGANEQVPVPHATTDDQGHFDLTTYSKGDGAPAGQYRVTVSWRESPDGKLLKQEDRDLSPLLIPTRYLNPETSGLTADVQSGTNQLPPLTLSQQ